MGLNGMIGQIVLLREFLISFHGNELTLGVLLANWLLLEAIGSFVLGKTADRTGRKLDLYVLFQMIFAVALPFAVYLSRTFKNILSLTPGEGLGLVPITYASFLILLPVTVPHGALFAYGSKLCSESRVGEAPSIGSVYMIETAGAILGGIATTFLLVRVLNAIDIAFLLTLSTVMISALLLWPSGHFLPDLARRTLWILSLVVALVSILLFAKGIPRKIHLASIHSQWKNLDVIHYENSVYGNITVTRRGEQFTFFLDGVPSINVPVPDIASVEDTVHFAMLSHEDPKSVLILGGGAGGMIHEILKYPVTRVDYVELDPLLLRLVRRFQTPLTESELSDPRVQVHDADGRFFVGRTAHRFDLVFVGLSAPQTLQANRFFSAEFFTLVRRRMNSRGILVFTLPGSLTYVSPELKDLNGCMDATLKQVFQTVRVIPGDTNLYLASDSLPEENMLAAKMTRRLEERKIASSLFNKGYIAYRLQKRWLEWYHLSYGGKEAPINSDFKPLGVFFGLSYWNALFSPGLSGIFKAFKKLGLTEVAIMVCMMTLLMAILGARRPRFVRGIVPYAIFATGLAAMVLNLSVVFMFQTFFGYLYIQIGLLVALFMAGAALGSFMALRQLNRISEGARSFFAVEVGIALFSLLVPFVFELLSRSPERPGMTAVLYATFLILALLSGATIGIQFPLGSRTYLISDPVGGVGHVAGLLYAADLLGGFVGGLLGGILLLPILGLRESCFMIGFLKMSSGALFLLSARIRR